MDKMVLELQTSEAQVITFGEENGLTKYKKELIKIGRYFHPGTKEAFEVTKRTLAAWVESFIKFTGGGSKVSIPLGHKSEGLPDKNAGWVTGMFVEGGSLFGIMELIDPDLALTTDVSICIEASVTDGKGVVHSDVITHVALCTNPVIVGLDKFTKLSLSIGENDMDFLKKLAEKLGLSKDVEPTEEAVMLALEGLKKPVKDKDKDKNKDKVSPIVAWVADKLGLSKDVEPTEEAVKLALEGLKKPAETVVADPIVKLIADNRALKLSNLVKAGLITPAVSTAITKKYLDPTALALSLTSKADDGFDTMYEILLLATPMKLDEVTGPQVELSKDGKPVENVMEITVNKARKAAGLKD